MRWIYISPHLDDAILSAGGLIYDQVRAGREVEIWTMFCSFPDSKDISLFAQELHVQWGFHSAEETIRARREEDLRATKIVGGRAVHFDFPDCIYRRDREGIWLYNNTFVSPRTEDASLSIQITQTLVERLEPSDELICPLAIGGHVDHVVVRRAVENLKRPLWYYADIPYLFNNPSALDLIERSMQAKSQKVSSRGLKAWQDAVAAYESQIPMEFESQRKMRKVITRYGRRGLSLWQETLNLLWENI